MDENSVHDVSPFTLTFACTCVRRASMLGLDSSVLAEHAPDELTQMRNIGFSVRLRSDEQRCANLASSSSNG